MEKFLMSLAEVECYRYFHWLVWSTLAVASLMAVAVVFIAGCVFFPSCFLFLRASLRKRYSTLSDVHVSNISVKCVSSLQALTSTCAGFIIMSSCPDIMTDSHWLSNTYAWFALPYFYYDIWAMYQTHLLFHPYLAEKSTWVSIRHYLSRNVVMMVHHVIMPMVFFPIILFLRKDQGDYFIGVFYMIEITIPFIALFTLLVQLKVTEQIYTIIAGLLMVIVFFVSRILVFPFLFWSYSNYANIGFWDVPGSIPIRCNVGCSLLLLPQLYWLVLMVKGAYKVLCKRMALRQVSLVSIGKAHGS